MRYQKIGLQTLTGLVPHHARYRSHQSNEYDLELLQGLYKSAKIIYYGGINW